MKFLYLSLASAFLLLTWTAKGQSAFSKTDDGKIIITSAYLDNFEKSGNFDFPTLGSGKFRSNDCGDPNYKPLFAYHFSGDSVTPQGEDRYICDEKGILKKIISTFYDGSDSIVSFYNGAYLAEGRDVTDSAIEYRKENGLFTPQIKLYYDYHLYDDQGEDSCYYTRIQQVWDRNNNCWKNALMDTYRFYSRAGHILEIKQAIADSEGNYTHIQFQAKDSLVCDEAGNVKWRIPFFHNGIELVENGDRFEYFYHEDGGPYYEIIYYHSSQTGEDWTPKMRAIITNIEWYEWNGFQDNSNYAFVFGDSYAFNHYYQTMSKIASYDSYGWSANEWGQTRTNKSAWDIDGTKTHVDSIYIYLLDNSFYLEATIHNNYNHCGNYTGNISYIWSNDSELHIESYTGTLYNIEYNQYGLEKSFTYLLDSQAEEPATFFMGTRITDFVPVSIAELSSQTSKIFLFPNPAQGETLIKSQETIHSIEIFDMMGRIVKTQEIHSNEAVISLNHLPRGLYLVKTLMKNGKKQVEKLLLQ